MGHTQSIHAPDATSELPSLEAAEQALRASWTPDTSDDPVAWNPDTPAAGQCVATTLVIQAIYGGVIVIADVHRTDGSSPGRGHTWNRLPSGEEVDFTYSQFRDERLGTETVWTPDLEGNPDRVRVLAARVGKVLGLDVDVSRVLPAAG